MAFGRRASATASASESTLMENSSNSRASTASSAAVDASSSRECASAPANPSSTASTQSIDATATPRTETQTLAAQPSSSASHSFPQYFPSLIPSPSPSSPLLGIPLDVLRVCQLDAERIDVELLGMLKEQLLRVFSLAPVCRRCTTLRTRIGRPMPLALSVPGPVLRQSLPRPVPCSFLLTRGEHLAPVEG